MISPLQLGSRYEHAQLDRQPTQLRTSSATRISLDEKRRITDRMNGGTDGISKMTKEIHTPPNTTSHFDARSRQRRRSSAEYSDRCLRGSLYMQRHC
jgi:hypothetical protein